jgi:GH35 family endo-1,4-beta-xylanase
MREALAIPVSEAALEELGNCYDFTAADAIVKFAKENDMQVCGHLPGEGNHQRPVWHLQAGCARPQGGE